MPDTVTPHRAWIRLPSGGRLDLINPDPYAWTNSDLACKLSRTFRWAGESGSWPNPLSVAQHSLSVLALREQESIEPLSALERLKLIAHDAEEGFLGVDLISPLKAALGEPIQRVSRALMEAIETRYELPEWTPESYKPYKLADTTSAASEAVHCVGWSVDEVRDVLGITSPILDVDPLVEVYGCVPWEPWAPELAASRFLAKLESLLEEVAQPSRRLRLGA